MYKPSQIWEKEIMHILWVTGMGWKLSLYLLKRIGGGDGGGGDDDDNDLYSTFSLRAKKSKIMMIRGLQAKI